MVVGVKVLEKNLRAPNQSSRLVDNGIFSEVTSI
jgi:hypothetical protein